MGRKLTIGAILVASIAAYAAYFLHDHPNTISLIRFTYDIAFRHMLSPSDNREQRLLEFVLRTAPAGNATAVLAAIDDYGWHKEFYMNVGDVKHSAHKNMRKQGKILDRALRNMTQAPQNLVEVGGYCGYSAVRIASQIPEGSKLYSIEILERNARIMRAMLEHAGLSHKVEILVGTVETVTPELRARGLVFDFVFLDHVKELYVSDLERIMNGGFMHPGTVIVADNLITPGAPDYIKYMQHTNRFQFTLYHSELEYTHLKDAVGVSVFHG